MRVRAAPHANRNTNFRYARRGARNMRAAAAVVEPVVAAAESVTFPNASVRPAVVEETDERFAQSAAVDR